MTSDKNDEIYYSKAELFFIALYLPVHWLFFFIGLIRHGGLRGMSIIDVDARVMSPRDWTNHLYQRGVDSWLLLPPTSQKDTIWLLAVRKSQQAWAREIVDRTNMHHAPKPWRKRKPIPGIWW